jgi:hypothetical protein
MNPVELLIICYDYIETVARDSTKLTCLVRFSSPLQILRQAKIHERAHLILMIWFKLKT